MSITPKITPGHEALADTWFSVVFHLDGLESAASRAAEFRRTWQLRTDIAAIPEHETWKSSK